MSSSAWTTSWLAGSAAAVLVVATGVLAFPFGIELASLLFFIAHRVATKPVQHLSRPIAAGAAVGSAFIVSWTVFLFTSSGAQAISSISDLSILEIWFDMDRFLFTKINEPYVIIYPLLVNLTTPILALLLTELLTYDSSKLELNITLKVRYISLAALFLFIYTKINHIVIPIVDLIDDSANYYISPIADASRGHFLIAIALPMTSVSNILLCAILVSVVANPKLLLPWRTR